MSNDMATDLIIIGAGAAGLMAGVRAGEAGLKCVVIERKHLAGRKLLMCGNARCNLTSDLSPAEMMADYGEPVSSFLDYALKQFSPSSLQRWMKQNGLGTTVHKDKRVFPSSERASDVLRLFTDLLRNYEVPILFNSVVESVVRCGDEWQVGMRNCTLCAKNVLFATGGVSYPKSGSVGDGQKMARELGHKVQPYRPGLVGYEVEERWLMQFSDVGFNGTQLRIVNGKGRTLGETKGEVRCERWGITGPAVVNASRLAARQNMVGYTFVIDLFPAQTLDELVAFVAGHAEFQRGDLERIVADLGISSIIAHTFCKQVLNGVNRAKGLQRCDAVYIAGQLKAWMVHPVKSRSLKEAMVTVGGVDLTEIDSRTMESKCEQGIYFSGEVMDIDGPTGGYNLQAAFSTARLAVGAIIEKSNITEHPRKPKNDRRVKKRDAFRGGHVRKRGYKR